MANKPSYEELESELRIAHARIAEQDARIVELESRIEKLVALVAKLEERLKKDSTNSSKPPSSDGPQSRAKRNRKNKKSPRKKGAQRGHKGANRVLLPQDEVDEIVDLFPASCELCGNSLDKIRDDKAHRHQVTELPPIRPIVTEFQRHSVMCSCGHKNRQTLEEAKIPSSSFGPSLKAMVGFLSGVMHLSRRQTAKFFQDVFGVAISLGSVSAIEAQISQALEPAFLEVWDAANRASIKHTDGTGWLEAGKHRSLWTIATSQVSFFKILERGTEAMVSSLFTNKEGILVSDRASIFGFWAMGKRQICWAHLLRLFIGFSEQKGKTKLLGQELCDATKLLFRYHRAWRKGLLIRSEFQRRMAPLQAQMEEIVRRAAAMKLDGISGSCKNLLKHRDAWWNFIKHEDVDPTNNHAERVLRLFVLWRRRCFGAQSTRGHVFAERIVTISETARKQKRSILNFLSETYRAFHSGLAPPKLLMHPSN